MWVYHDSCMVAPTSLLPWIPRCVHTFTHAGKCTWYAPGISTIEKQICENCVTCQTMNPGKMEKVKPASHPNPTGPFVYLQIDFYELPMCMGFKYVLVIVDVFSRWIEAFPCKKADATAVAKYLLK